MIEAIETVSEGWCGFPADKSDERGSFKGMTARDIYTKAAHLILVKEMVVRGNIVLTTEQEATLPPLVPHIFTDLLIADVRAGSGGARIGGSYIQGAIFNPKVLISLLNIFRADYNFFEPRPFASPYEEIDELIGLPPKARRTPARRTPAMPHGMDAFTKRKDGTEDVPDLYRVLYRPWLYAVTKVGAKFDRSRNTRPIYNNVGAAISSED